MIPRIPPWSPVLLGESGPEQIRPVSWTQKLQDALNRISGEQAKHRILVLPRGPVIADFATTAEYNRLMLLGGVMSRDEARMLRGEATIEVMRYGSQLTVGRCKHGIERDRCLTMECVANRLAVPKVLPALQRYGISPFSGFLSAFLGDLHVPDHTIPVYGEDSWVSRIAKLSATSSQNPAQSGYLARPSLQILPVVTPFRARLSASAKSKKSQPKPPPPVAIPRTMPAIGYRSWDVSGHTLYSLGGALWPARKRMVAHCARSEAARRELSNAKKALMDESRFLPTTSVTHATATFTPDIDFEPHEPAGWECGCGIWILQKLEDVPLHNENLLSEGSACGLVVGWGNVVRHGDEGFRAQYARVVALLDTRIFAENETLVKAAKNYGVPILGRKALMLYASEYGEGFK